MCPHSLACWRARWCRISRLAAGRQAGQARPGQQQQAPSPNQRAAVPSNNTLDVSCNPSSLPTVGRATTASPPFFLALHVPHILLCRVAHPALCCALFSNPHISSSSSPRPTPAPTILSLIHARATLAHSTVAISRPRFPRSASFLRSLARPT